MASKTIATILSLKDSFSSTIKQTTSNTKAFQNQIKSTQNQVKDMKEAINGAFKGVVFKAGGLVAGLGLVDFAKESLMLASDLVEVQNVVDVTFGSTAATINNWSQTALKSFGLSELQAKQFTGTLGAMFKSSGITGKGLISMSENLTGLSGDLASFYNLPIDEAMQKIRSGISGETMPLKELGINMDVANLSAYALSKGIHTAYDKMSQAEQTTLRYNYLMSVTKGAQGDFIRTSSGFANQLRVAQTGFKQLGASIASYALPYINKIVTKFNDLINVAPKMVTTVKSKATEMWNAFKVSSVFNTLKLEATSTFKAIKDTISFLKKPFQDFVESVVRFAKTFWTDISPTIDYIEKNVKPKIWDDVKFAIKDVLDIATSTFNFISANWSTIKPLVESITIAIVAWKVATMAIATWTGIVTAVTSVWSTIELMIWGITNATSAWQAIQWILNVAMSANPIGVVILAIAALTLAIIEVVKHWKIFANG